MIREDGSPAENESFAGSYRILRPLARGGTARVYLAEQLSLKRKAALKVFDRQGLDPSDALRFLGEARALSFLSHPAIVPLYDFGETPEALYLVTPYFASGSLRDRLQQGGAIDPRIALRWTIRLLEALEAIHDRDIIHRDIKPANILLDEQDQPVLIDFGLIKARELVSARTMLGEVVGTLEYLPPEVIMGEEPDHTADLYAMGLILYEMVTGSAARRCLPLEITPEDLLAIAADPGPPPVATIDRGLPASLDDPIRHATRPVRADRPVDARSWKEELQAVLVEIDPLSFSARNLRRLEEVAQATVPRPAVEPSTPPVAAHPGRAVPVTMVTPPSARWRRAGWLMLGAAVATALLSGLRGPRPEGPAAIPSCPEDATSAIREGSVAEADESLRKLSQDGARSCLVRLATAWLPEDRHLRVLRAVLRLAPSGGTSPAASSLLTTSVMELTFPEPAPLPGLERDSHRLDRLCRELDEAVQGPGDRSGPLLHNLEDLNWIRDHPGRAADLAWHLHGHSLDPAQRVRLARATALLVEGGSPRQEYERRRFLALSIPLVEEPERSELLILMVEACLEIQDTRAAAYWLRKLPSGDPRREPFVRRLRAAGVAHPGS